MKTQITDSLFVFNTIQQILDNKLDIKLKIFYFSLEMSKEEKMRSIFSNILYIKEGIRVSPKDLRSTKKDKILPENILNILNKYEPYFIKMEEVIEFISDIRNPTGIFKHVREYAYANGTQLTKEINVNGKVIIVDDYYKPNNTEEYVMIVIDHIGLISTESEGGKALSLHQSIVKLSSTYLIQLRNKYGYIPVVIQQQAAAQESVNNMNAGKLKPTLDGLGDCKLTSRDANVILGLFSPFRHEEKEYFGYDITIFKDNIRFLEIIGGREGGAGVICPLYFDGAVNVFRELPLPFEINKLKEVYKIINKIRNKIN